MKNIFFALFMGFSAMINAQQLSGIVTDSNNNPIQNATVYAREFREATLTDLIGKFELKNLPQREITIEISALGFISQKLKATSASTIVIVLEQTVHQMDEVIISTAFNRAQAQNVMKVETETIKSMQQQGAVTLVDGLQSIPGVSQISTGSSIGKPVIRGLSGNRVLVYSQGIRLENQQFGGEHGLGLNDSGVESVEVIKGPASLLYGSDALGGVIYFNPENFASANKTVADFNQRLFSNTLGSNTSIGIKTSGESWKYLLRGSFSTHSDYQIPTNQRVLNTRFNETDIKAAIGYSNKKMSSILRYNYNNLDLGIPEEGLSDGPLSKQPLFPKQLVENHIISFRNNFYFTHSKLESNIGYILNDRNEFEDSEVPSLRMKLETVNYDLKYHLPKVYNIALIAGIQGMHQTNTNFADEFLIPDARTTDFGAFATGLYEWNSNVIQAGIRFDVRNITSDENGTIGDEGYFAPLAETFNSYTTSLGYKKDFSQKVTLRLNFASGFRAPNLAELTSNGVHEGTNRYEIGNSQLKTEQNFQYDLNLEYRTTHFEFFANGFYNHINNYIYTLPTGETIEDNEIFQYVQSDANLYGGEIGIHFHPHPLDWLHLESTFETVTGKQKNGSYLPLIPANTWENTLRGEFKIKTWLQSGFAKFSIANTFAQRNVDGFESESEGYLLCNLGLGGKIKIGETVFDASLNANNLFDKTYISHLSRLKVDGLPNIGRNIVMQIGFTL